MMEKVIHAKIARYSPDAESRTDEYQVPYQPGMTYQVLLRYIYENLDPTLSFRDFRCGRGACNTCRIKVNGKTVRACATPVKPNEETFLEPAGNKVIKDLVISYD